MSSDTRIMLWYEPQPYKDNYPKSEVDSFNSDPDNQWLDMLAKGGDMWTFTGWLDHFPDKILGQTTADQVFLIREGNWGWEERKRCSKCSSFQHADMRCQTIAR